MFFWKSPTVESDKVFNEGAQARATGRSLDRNPYPVTTAAHAEWQEGWKATFDLDEDDDCDSCRNRVEPEYRA